MGFFLTLAAFAGGYATGAKMGDRPMVLARNAMNDVRARATSAADSARSIASDVAVPLVDVRPVRDVMSTPVESVSLDAPLREAAKQMQRRRIGDVFVVDDAGQLRGIVTDRDLAVLSDRRGSKPGHARPGDHVADRGGRIPDGYGVCCTRLDAAA